MIDFTPGADFLIAVQRPYRKNEVLTVYGVTARIVEQISYEDYIEVWAWRGFPSEGISINPKYYYRCEILSGGKPPLTNLPDSEPALRGGEESGL